jgi:ABC-2 type transport system ATP-binding protein
MAVRSEMNNYKSPIIQTVGLTKKYGELLAVDGLDLAISEGEIFGLLGPNGSGKTTIILMLLGLTEPTSGSVRVCGFDPVREPFKVKRITGYLPERLGFYENLTAVENLRYFTKLNQIPDHESSKRISNVLYKVGLSDREDTKVNQFSRGMKQRLGIANVLVKKPKLVILDEPTQGIDPKGIQEILDLFTRINREEKITIILASHLIHHVQQICNNIGIMSNGRMIKRGALKLGDFNEQQNWIIEFEVQKINEALLDLVAEMPQVIKFERDGKLITAECKTDIRSEISRLIINNGGSLTGLRLIERSLVDVYKKYSEGF